MGRRSLTFVLLTVAVLFGFFSLIYKGVEGRGDRIYLTNPITMKAVAFARTQPIHSLDFKGDISQRNNEPFKLFETKILPEGGEGSPRTFSGDEPSPKLSDFLTQPMPGPLLSVTGMENLDNGLEYGLLFLPADMTGDVGPAHYVQAVNSLIRVFNKSGAPLTPPIRISRLFQPLGTPCSTRFDGLPNVLYDPLADRWLISQTCTAFSPFRQLVAISTSGDPTGSYYAYEFAMPNVRLNDFPKFGVWHDGYYMVTDEFLGADYFGSGMFAFDRTKMLYGDPDASYIYFNLPESVPIRRRGMLPADLDGLRAPPKGRPNTFASFNATEYGDETDAIRFFDFTANFNAPFASTFVERPESPITVAAFDPTSPEGRADIAQPPPGERLDSQSDRLGHRLAYRNHGSHESLVVNQTVRSTPLDSTYRAAIRMYEFRREDKGFVVQTLGTIGDVNSSRWIGSAAQDHQGNLAVGYNYVADNKRVSILYSGRLSTDPPGQFRTEAAIIEGTGVQKAFGWRWGEYSGMSVDPVDDCTFWITNGYYSLESEEFSDFGWLTRIGSFRFPECAPAEQGLLSGTVTDKETGLPIPMTSVQINDYFRSTSDTGTYGPALILPGDYVMTVSARGYRTQTRSITVVNGSVTESFVLEPIPVLISETNSIVGESCGVNGSPEPGETVAIDVSFRNEGTRTANNVTAEIISTGEVVGVGGVRQFGNIPPDSPPVNGRFTFRVNATVQCGADITLSIRILANGKPVGTIDIPFRAGAPVVSLSTDFDDIVAPELPLGWSTSSSANHQLWRTSVTRRESEPNSIFSPAPIQAGVNELISPPFAITSQEAEITFRNWYELETTFLRNRLYDGSVLELKIGNSEWQDLVVAGGRFLAGGYDGTIDTCCSNPLGGRQGWSGRSGINQTSEFITSHAILPASAAGQSVRLRWRIGTDIGTFREGQYIDDLVVRDGFSCSCPKMAVTRAPFDFDGDGRTDLSHRSFNDQQGVPDVSILFSRDEVRQQVFFGSSNDQPAFADFDGDGKTDIAVFRPSDSTWYILTSLDGTITFNRFGLPGDIPVPADFDGDSLADVAVFRPSEGVWYLDQSKDGFAAIRFGLNGDLPVPADFDGDGRVDVAVFRPADGNWYSNGSLEGVNIVRFGRVGDLPVAGDYSGDGKADRAIFRPSESNWYILSSTGGFEIARFGQSNDVPLLADIDGDGRIDISLYRHSDRTWYYLRTSDGEFRADRFGREFDMPIPMPQYLSLTPRP